MTTDSTSHTIPDDMRVAPAVPPDKLRYYDFQRNWSKRAVPHLAHVGLNALLVRDFNRYTYGRWGERFLPGDLPSQFESCDWRLGHRQPHPRYWDYVKHGAAHWLVNFNLGLATLAEPGQAWRIITSDRHSCVWDGGMTLFDLNLSALGASPRESFSLAYVDELPPGRLLRVHYAQHYSTE